MVSITIPLEPELKEDLKHFVWVNWSEVGREELLRKVIFDKFIATGQISDKDWEFCEQIDWHPVDELPMKKDFIKRIESARKEKSIKLKSVSDIFE